MLERNYGILFCATYMFKLFNSRTIFESKHDWLRHIRIYNFAGFTVNVYYLLMVGPDAEVNYQDTTP